MATTAKEHRRPVFLMAIVTRMGPNRRGSVCSEVRSSLNIQCMGTDGLFEVMYDRVPGSVMAFCRSDFRDVSRCFDVEPNGRN